MNLTTTEICKKYNLNRQKLSYAAKKGLRFKKKIINGRAVNTYKEKDLLQFIANRAA